jgi:hypothetical protein
MRCNQLEELLADYLQQKLDPHQIGAVEAHVAQCSECAEQVALWKKLALLPDEMPSPTLRTNFEAMLAAYQRGRAEQKSRESRWWSVIRGSAARLLQPALALVLIALGFAAGKYVNAVSIDAQQLRSLHQELNSMRQLVALSLLEQQSASERLQGVRWSLRANHADPEILSALLHTLRFDTSADVRLAALDALKHYHANQQVRSGLIEALLGQQSPLVQIALIDLLVELRETSALRSLEEFELKQDLEPVVRQRARWGIAQLTRG